ncbi:MAG TPA: DUF2442 domain-containing protein, partial [Steroidobacteraceae bacterium]|nr:DUF2442 domain-containing protein [Steroidobacteraceae bacterium]
RWSFAAQRAKNRAKMAVAPTLRTKKELAMRQTRRTVPANRRAGRGRMIAIVKVLKVQKVGGLRLRLRFSDGTEGVRDLSDIVNGAGWMVAPLRDPKFFARVFVQIGTLTWPDGFDLDSIALHDEMKDAGQLRKSAA